MDAPPLRQTPQTIASLAPTRYSQCRGEASSACLLDPNTFCSRHLCFLLACLRSPSARILHRQKSYLQVPRLLNPHTIPFSSLPLATIPTGACGSAKKALSAWIAPATPPSLSNPPMLPMKPPPIPDRKSVV